MTYRVTSQFAVPQDIEQVSSVQNVPLGTIVKGLDPLYGEAEFIYLKGVAACIKGSWVQYNSTVTGAGATSAASYDTILLPNTANLDCPVAIAMAALVAATFGWFMISGSGIAANNGTMAAGNAPVYVAAAGQVTSTAAAGKQVLNARSLTATGVPAANQFLAYINRPFMQGQIT